ncbi:uncharacterized protein DUF732 [Geodermatophilus normandii]|uniref:Uncharacterized protein DUF732 n=1 Tax=Geodermatophilus normandii TaxID=1137989 RepID=A0A317QLD8_9ACTN|nr:DUF732 domain-containing protein [Geodermatophilus normandii]PWW23511.1 uncharacterized protein DUF732 [Geodermatophilus normandii]
MLSRRTAVVVTALAMAVFASAVAVTLVVLRGEDTVAAPPPTAAATSTGAPDGSRPAEPSTATTTATRALPRPGEQVMDVSPEADARYLGTLSAAGLLAPGDDEDEVIEVGRLVCAYVSTGQGDVDDAGVMVLSSGLVTASDAGTIVGAAVGAYCPQYGAGL